MNPQNKADEVYIRVVEEHPWLLKLPIVLEDLKIAVASAYLVGECDGLAEMKETTDRIMATWGPKMKDHTERFICDCGNIYSSLAAIESCQNHHNQMKHDTPQEYYDQKDRCARLCVDAIKALESLKTADLPYADKYKSMIAFIDTRLNNARYTGD